ncbi:RNA-binding ATPase activator esf2 [Microbotryomycetes sp. JL201]|nr:RNA-binding ATPase activator esf2 [Microbotryomycetes sp. JL201]
MVSFSCEACNDTVKKPKLPNHYNNCGAPFTCIDCNVTFHSPNEWKTHTSCISEDQKYQKTLYKGPKVKIGTQQQQQTHESAKPAAAAPASATEDVAMTVDEPATAPASAKKEKKNKKKDKKRKLEEVAVDENVAVDVAENVKENKAQEPVKEAEAEPVTKKAKKDKKKSKKAAQDTDAAPVVNEEEAAATVAAPDAAPETEEADEPSLSIEVAAPSAPPVETDKKQSKKDKKKEKQAKQAKAQDEPKADGGDITGDYHQQLSKLQSFLGQIWPAQFKSESKPLVQHRIELCKQVQQSSLFKKFYNDLKTTDEKKEFDEWVWDIFMRGCHIGGKKPKRSLSLKFTRKAMAGLNGGTIDEAGDADDSE